MPVTKKTKSKPIRSKSSWRRSKSMRSKSFRRRNKSMRSKSSRRRSKSMSFKSSRKKRRSKRKMKGGSDPIEIEVGKKLPSDFLNKLKTKDITGIYHKEQNRYTFEYLTASYIIEIENELVLIITIESSYGSEAKNVTKLTLNLPSNIDIKYTLTLSVGDKLGENLIKSEFVKVYSKLFSGTYTRQFIDYTINNNKILYTFETTPDLDKTIQFINYKNENTKKKTTITKKLESVILIILFKQHINDPNNITYTRTIVGSKIKIKSKI